MIRIPETTDETFGKLLDFGKAMGKATVNCKVNTIYKPIDIEDLTVRGMLKNNIDFHCSVNMF